MDDIKNNHISEFYIRIYANTICEKEIKLHASIQISAALSSEHVSYYSLAKKFAYDVCSLNDSNVLIS